MTTVISIEHLSKFYRLGLISSRTLVGDIQRWWTRLRGQQDPLLTLDQAPTPNGFPNGINGHIWALQDVSFDVQQGEVVGIIGRNGAGKSTLLKILSRVTAPTSGEVKVKGRIASLLEVGTGFHPELTGRENIYLNGAILGMRRGEVRQKFDEIVAFAEIEKFIDTPVKRYSSGMYVRLAFAVAAHLEPDILIVDEVLAVGDAAFQDKCLRKMGEAGKQGRTVLFVSHNIAAINRLCQRGIVLDSGRLSLDTSVFEATRAYLASHQKIVAEKLWNDFNSAPGNHMARLKAVRVISQGEVKEIVDIRFPLTIEMEYWILRSGEKLVPIISFLNEHHVILFVSAQHNNPEWKDSPTQPGLYRARCTVPGNTFAEGQVHVASEICSHHPPYEIHFLEFASVVFRVLDVGEPGSVRAGWGREILGLVRPALEWHFDYLAPV